MGLIDRLQHSWNAFMNKDPTYRSVSYSYRPDRARLSKGGERTIVNSIYNRISLDVASCYMRHVKLDDNNRYLEEVNSGLNNCLSLEANLDQTSRAFLQDVCMSLLDEGCIALVPTVTDVEPKDNAFDVLEMRTGKILEWKPYSIKVQVYNHFTGMKEEKEVPKKSVGIIENPFYSIMNEHSATMQRLIRKLALLDVTDDDAFSGKMNMIIQLPYTTKTELQKKQAKERVESIKEQLHDNEYGIAYVDATEKITQLNRPIDNNLMDEIKYLTELLFSQLGITQSILDGTADEQTMLNYQNRVIEPILSAIADEMKRKFLTKTARTKKHSIMFFKDPFKLVPVNNISEIADKFTRNEIMTPNEIRQIVGMKPAQDPQADELRNRNLSQSSEEIMNENGYYDENPEENYQDVYGQLDDIDSQLDDLEYMIKHSDLYHYASKYYDPVKTHEYYINNRQLKGKMSTEGMNEAGKEVASYVKNQLNTERKNNVEQHKNATNSTIESLRNRKISEIQQNTERTNSQIRDIRQTLKNMSKEEKAEKSEELYEIINNLRNSNKMQRDSLNAEYKINTTQLRDEHKQAVSGYKTQYENDVETEFNKIRSEKQYQSKKSRRNHKNN